MVFVNAEAVQRRRRKVYKNRSNYYEELDDQEFFRRFRLTKPSVRLVLDRINAEIRHRTER